jgi:glycosyltransferase involved in cell wall biosynthesis
MHLGRLHAEVGGAAQDDLMAEPTIVARRREEIPLDILVCSHNDAAYLPRLFDSLRGQTAGPDAFRVIFVDNASTDDTRLVVAEHGHGLDVLYLYEPALGKNRAINLGYSYARSEYVAHTDSDCAVAPDWVERILATIEAVRPDLIGGAHLPYYVSKRPQWYLDAYNSSIPDGPARVIAEKRHFVDGANMAWRRAVVEQVGGFMPGLGMTGRGVARGDEKNLQVRAYDAVSGLKVFVDPDLLVYHVTRPHMMSVRYRWRRGWQRGLDWMRIMDAPPLPVLRALLVLCYQVTRLVWTLGIGAMARNRSRYPYVQNYWYEGLFGVFTRIGYAWSSLICHAASATGRSGARAR